MRPEKGDKPILKKVLSGCLGQIFAGNLNTNSKKFRLLSRLYRFGGCQLGSRFDLS
ncbi:hypothetical protein [Bacillus sp. ISL-45]|uniref:hypothetical protein n=1 Tax=Bacillus sp. ISL-45 TaxID=2819128 RepID=UPI001BE709EA|nr:hypothetical protein [Bacillus sp. ISL-45]